MGSPPEDEPTLSVRELGAALDGVLRERFASPVWVRGEVAGMHRSAAGHVYFDLCEQGAKAQVTLFARTATAVDRRLAQAGLALADGVELRVRVQPSFHAPFGRLQLLMDAVDPAFTAGRLALAREQLLAALRADGSMARNAALPLAEVPLRIAVITSVGSAAWNDVVHQLEAAGCAFELVAADARVQGGTSPDSLLDALRACFRLHRQRPLDLVAVVRGGGSRTDLAAFDDERVARALTHMEVPVWTGIGHDVDTTVADAVAHTAFPTPTAVGAALRTRAEQARARTDDRRRRLAPATRAVIDGAQDRVLARAERLVRARRGLLNLHAEQHDSRRRRLEQQVRSTLDAEADRLEARARQVEALDPVRVLARGFSVTRHADGRVVRGVAAVEDGEVLVTDLADGSVRSTALRSEEVT
jgi:exodeoxyribonuclease VII large subunit